MGPSAVDFYAYTYVGSEEIRRSTASQPAGTPVASAGDVDVWLRANPDAITEGATYVVDLQGRLRLAPRRSEHVACAGGEEVLAAEKIHFQGTDPRLTLAGISNQSTGYCPDTSCWAAVVLALRHAGLEPPRGFSPQIVFRRCPRCAELNLVKEAWFVCVFCDADLPAGWNVAPRRKVRVSGAG